MKLINYLNFDECIGHSTLLYGETDTKKTLYTAKFVKFLLESKKINPQEISILDFAPKLAFFKDLKIGGRIQDYYNKSIKCKNFIFEGEIIPPRLKAKSKSELYKNICSNYKITSKILNNFKENPTDFLIINDISIYLHLGSKRYILETIFRVNTFFGNSYYGTSIKSKFPTLLSINEKKKVNFLIKNIKNSYFTG
ncbi:MAG: hypothetical protein KAT66_07170 [Candidatus Lokiarchaeota archaeon]|nr:hypothetical protein [Candidatus Lokiarchaeota archaeon]